MGTNTRKFKLALTALTLAALVLSLGLAIVPASPVQADGPVFDGVISPGEWDDYFLGTSTHHGCDGGGGDEPHVSCNVYAYRTATHFYVAWEMVDCSTGWWATARGVNIHANFYLKGPISATWPEPGYTLLTMSGNGQCGYGVPGLKHTDGTTWVCISTLAGAGIDYGYTFTASPDVGVGEFKIPWTQFSAGEETPIALFGQYWGYGFDTDVLFEPAPSEVWVDDDWAGASTGDPVDGHTFGYNAFATIQDGIDNVAGSTVNVAAGTYNENVTINKSLTLKAGSNPVIDPGGGTAVTIDASNVTITGFTIQNAATGILATSGTGNVIHFCDIVNNTTWGLNNTSGNLVDAENNWWGDDSGPKDDAGTKEVPEDYSCGDVTVAEMKNANGLGDEVSDDVDYCPWTGAETKTETVSGSGTMGDTSTGGDITIDATGDHTISTSMYVSNPGGDHTFRSTGYYDVHLDDKTGVASLTVEFCPATEDTVIYYWNGADWVACSNQVFNPGQQFPLWEFCSSASA